VVNVPTCAFTDHVTAVFAVPVTVAVNAWLWEELSATEEVLRDIPTDEAALLVP
jgi:hypothetical protein